MFAIPILETLLALIVSSAPLAHPHNPKALVLGGAQGKATLTYFTVPYNADQVATLPNGADWHMGFAGLNVEMAMTQVGSHIPPARYKLNVRRGDDGSFKQMVLVPWDLYSASRGRRANPEKVAAAKKDLQEKGIPEEIVLALQDVKVKEDAEHMEFWSINRGYEAAQRGSAEPKAGAKFELYVSFGDLHKRLALEEVFAASEKEGR